MKYVKTSENHSDFQKKKGRGRVWEEKVKKRQQLRAGMAAEERGLGSVLRREGSGGCAGRTLGVAGPRWSW